MFIFAEIHDEYLSKILYLSPCPLFGKHISVGSSGLHDNVDHTQTHSFVVLNRLVHDSAHLIVALMKPDILSE